MGSFATMGAIAGAAKGWQEGSEKQEAKEQNRLDQEREERLATLANSRATTREQAGYAQENALQAQKASDTATLEESKSGYLASAKEKSEKFTASESALDRENKLAVARIDEEGRANRARETAGGWSYRSVITGGGVDPASGAPLPEKSALLLTDKESQVTYQQEGDIFRRFKDDSPIRSFKDGETKAKAERKLMENPTFKAGKAFYDRVRYLPIGWFKALKDAGTISQEN